MTRDWSLNSGERQVATRLEQAQPSHVSRYRLAALLVASAAFRTARKFHVLDALCGTGYGSAMIAWDQKVHVDAFDGSPEAIEFARKTWPNPQINFYTATFPEVVLPEEHYDVAVAFEAIEHVDDGEGLLRRLATATRPDGMLLLSSPDEDRLPFGENWKFHTRHWTESDLRIALARARWQPIAWERQLRDGTSGPDGVFHLLAAVKMAD